VEAAKAPSGPQRRRWPRSLKIFRNALETALAEHSQRIWPFSNEGPEVMAVAEAKVRAEFMAAYPATGDDPKKKADTKSRAFLRTLKAARECGLIMSREVGGVDLLWPTDKPD
jgi:hypothetical protein